MEILRKYGGVLAVVAVVIAIVAFYFPKQVIVDFGNKTASFWDTAEGYKVDGTTVINGSGQLILGTNGSTVTELKAALCDISGTTDTSHAATSTKYYYCAVTGVASGDVVFAQLASTSALNVIGSWVITDAKASSTAGFIDLMIMNLTGAARVPSAAVGGFASSTNVLYLDI